MHDSARIIGARVLHKPDPHGFGPPGRGQGGIDQQRIRAVGGIIAPAPVAGGNPLIERCVRSGGHREIIIRQIRGVHPHKMGVRQAPFQFHARGIRGGRAVVDP